MISTFSVTRTTGRAARPIDFEEVAITGAPTPLTASKVVRSEFGFFRLAGGPIRALWHPDAALVLTNAFGVLFNDGDSAPLTREEMIYWTAILDAGAVAAKLQIHYYTL